MNVSWLTSLLHGRGVSGLGCGVDGVFSMFVMLDDI
jgi:hypothetical protein